MKTYLIEKDFGRDLRVTVEDDISPRVQFSERPDVMVVVFEKRVGSYDTEYVMAVSAVTSLRPVNDDSVIVEEKRYDHVSDPQPSPDPIVTWTSL